MAMKTDEMEILRAVSTKLDNDTLFIMTYQYHTEKDPDDPEGKKNLKSASRYRMIGRIEKIADLEAKMINLRQDENRLADWKWPDDPDWTGKILYSKDSSNAGRSNWIRLKLNKAISWENALALMQGFKKDTDKTSKTFGQYVVRNPSAAYDMKGYTCTNGDVIDIDDKEALLAHVGQNVYKEIKMKLCGRQD
jgi:hypothetical protein